MKNKNADLIKIFLFYHKPYKLLCNNIFQPVLNGNGTSKLYKNRLKPLSIKDFPAGGGGISTNNRSITCKIAMRCE